MLTALRATNWLELEPQQTDRASLHVILLSAAGVAPNTRDRVVIINLVMITVLVV